MMADAPPPPSSQASIEHVVSQNETRDALSEYHAMVAGLGSVPEGFVDPHVAEIQANAADEVTGQSLVDDVDPQHLSGPSEADLAAGEEVDPAPGSSPADDGQDETLPSGAESDAEPEVPATGEDEVPQAQQPGADPVEVLAKQLRAANSKLSLVQAAQKAEEILSTGAQTEEPAASTDAAQTESLPTADALETEYRELQVKWRKSIRELDDEDAIKAQEDRMTEIEGLLPKARAADEARSQQGVQAFEASAKKAMEFYPDAAKEGTPLFNRMAEIHSTLEETNDPLLHDPNKALVIAQMAAKELQIAPRRAASAPAQRVPAKPNGQRGPATPMTASMPAAGAHRRTTVQPQPAASQKIESLDSPEAYAAYIRSLAGK